MIAILNYGFGNIKSISNALKYSEIDFRIIDNFKEIKKFNKIILPGVGFFSPAITKLKKMKFDENIKSFVDNKENTLFRNLFRYAAFDYFWL